jgi:thiol-disulfide isomerase/thioredoxin
MKRALLLAVALTTVAALGIHTPVGAAELPPFPNLTFIAIDGDETTTLESFRGRPVLINFWASWCGPCRMELPELQRLYNDYAGDGFVLVTVNMDSTPSAAHRFMELTRLSVPVYRMDRRELAYLGVESLPTSILIAPSGQPVQIYEGYSPAVAQEIHRLVAAMLETKRPLSP